MADVLLGADAALFRFLNGTLGNPLFDAAMPVITDLNLTWYGRILIGGAWLLLLLRGGRRGRVAALLLIPLIAVSDQLSSSLIKNLVMRPRPCHVIDGAPVIDGVRLLVGCGGGWSFPSSHAVNHFAAATFLAGRHPRWSGWLFGWAALGAFSRISVGVHYPSDVAAGALIGMGTAWLFGRAWRLAAARFPRLDPPAGEARGDARGGTAG